MIRIQAIPTWRCNFYDFKNAKPHGANCPYCVIFSPMATVGTYFQYNTTVRPIEREMTLREWTEGILHITNGLREKVLFDFTGGEPLLYKGFDLLIHNLTKLGHQWVITSNTSLTGFIEDYFKEPLFYQSLLGWTSSWHPSSRLTINQFIDNLKYIKSKRDSVTTTVVLHESTKGSIEKDIRLLNEAGIPTQIHLFQAEDYDFERDASQEMKEVYERLKMDNKQHQFSWEDNPIGIQPIRNCVANHKACTVSSDGSVFLCYEHLNVKADIGPIGKWGQYRFSKEITRDCEWVCRYPCDRLNIIEGQ